LQNVIEVETLARQARTIRGFNLFVTESVLGHGAELDCFTYGTNMSSSLLLPVFPPVQYWSLIEEEFKTTTHPPHNDDDEGDESSNKKNNTNVRRVSVSKHHHHDGVDGVILTILPPPQSSSPPPPHRHHHHHYRILLQRKLRHHTGTGGDTHVGFVVQESGDNDGRAVTTADREVQMVHVRMESSAVDSHLVVRGGGGGGVATDVEGGAVRADDGRDDKNGAFSSSSLSLWETTIDPGFRALQWLTDQLLVAPPRMSPSRDSDDFATPYRLDLSAHLLLAKNEFHAVCVTPRRSNAVSLADYVTLMVSRDEVRWTEDSARCLFRDILTVRNEPVAWATTAMVLSVCLIRCFVLVVLSTIPHDETS
jgi:hypothetical protein